MKYIQLKVQDELYRLTAEEADRRNVGMIDVVVEALAKHFKKPGLGVVPRARLGRRRLDQAVNGESHDGNGKKVHSKD